MIALPLPHVHGDSARSWRLRAAAAVAAALAGCLAVPLAGHAVKTVEADRGEATPVAVANAYLLAVFSGCSVGEPRIRRCLYRDRESELLAEVLAPRLPQ